jgi:acetate kinase
MTTGVLAVNAGSSSLKLALFEAEDGEVVPRLRVQVTWLGDAPALSVKDAAGASVNADVLAGDEADPEAALARVLPWLWSEAGGAAAAVAGHRVVHGGRFDRPVPVDAAALERLEALSPLAPLHQPHNLAAIRALQQQAPQMAQVACFDTAFHWTQPAQARRFALPRWLSEQGVERYGFHGLSYAYVARALPELIGDTAYGRVVVAHLGHGASMCALWHGQSVATTMGLTALDGLPMGRRCGALDPGVILYLMDRQGMDADRLRRLLYEESGLLGVSGSSDDMAELLSNDAPDAAEAVDLFCYRAARELGSLAAALGGLDALVFTGGIGEHAAEVRRRICRQAHWLGVRLDDAANDANAGDIAAPDARVAVRVVPTDEECTIARETLACIPTPARRTRDVHQQD